MKENLPLYKILVNEDDESGIEFISLVKSPAIEINWVAFSKQMQFAVDVEQRKLIAPFVVPDQPIYRNDEEFGEYYVVFDKENIQKMAEKFNRSAKNQNINLEHKKNSKVEGAYVSENWIVDGEDKTHKYGFSLPDGSWAGVVKIDNQEFWDEYIKTGEVLGFSVEGLLGMQNIKQTKQTMSEKIELAAVVTEFPLADDTSLFLSDAVMTLGLDATADDKGTVAPDGEYVTKDNVVITVKGGKVVGLEMKAEEETEVEAPVAATEELSLAEVPAETPSTTPTDVASVEQLIKDMQAAYTQLSDRVTALEEALTSTQDANTELKSKVEAFSKLPGAVSISTVAAKASVVKTKQTFEDKLIKLRSLTK
jgi:hypothetical protein